MEIIPYSDDISKYLQADEVIDFNNPAIQELADRLYKEAVDDIDYIRLAYNYVQKNISHSADIGENLITCSASEVLKAGHGICFAKSHLLAAILRCKAIPAGLCYQKLILDVDTAPILVYHGLNGVYIEKMKKWIRLDARGSQTQPNAKFSLEEEQLEFPVDPGKGEKDVFVVFWETDANVLEKMRVNKTRTQLWDNLPLKLAYDKLEGEL